MNKHLDILIVEDSEDDAVLLLREIKKGGYDPNFVRVENAEDMRLRLNEQTWDIVISDYSLPGFDAPEALKVLQETGLDLPFIIVSGKVEDEVAVECMTAGAHDFIRKDNMVRLIPAIERELSDFIVRKEHDIAEIAVKESKELLATIAENYPNSYVSIIKKDMTIGFSSGKEFKNQNLDAEDFVGLTLEEVFGEQTPVIKEHYLETFGGKETSFELFFNKQYLKFNTVPLFDKNDEVNRILTVVENITEQKQTEKALQESESEFKRLHSMLRLMCDNLPELIWTKDLDNKFMFANKACCDDLLNARDTDEPIGRTSTYFSVREQQSHPEVPNYHTLGKRCTSSDEEVLRYRKVIRTEESGTIKGKFVIHDVLKAPFYNEEGNLIGTVGCAKDITERKQAEEEFVKLARFNESIITSIPVGIVTLDQVGKITSTNDIFLKMMGSPNIEEILKLGIHTHSIEATGISKAIKNTLMTGSSFDMNDIPYTSHWGKELIINLRGVPLKDMSGIITGVVLVIDDVTGMAKAEQALHESEMQYRTLFESSPDAIFLADPESGMIIDANQAASKLLQKPIGEIIGLHQTQLHPPRLYDYSRSVFEEHARKSETSRFETIMLRSDGGETPVEVSAEPITIKGKTILQGIFRDITERKNVEEMMQLNEMRIKALLDLGQMSDSSFTGVADFVLKKIVHLTKSEYGFVGLMNEDESVFTTHSWAKNVMDICAVDGKSMVIPIETAGVWGDAVRERKVIIINDYSDLNIHETGLPEGHVPISRVLSIPIFEDGKIVAVAIVANKEMNYDNSDVRHITLLMDGMWKLIQRRQAEENLKKYAEELVKSNEELKSLDTMKNDFLSNVSHELKTPLISIKGFSEIVQDELYGPLTDKQKTAMDTVVRNCDRLGRLIDSVLYLTVKKAGKDTYAFVPVNVSSIIGDAIIDIYPQANSKDLTIEQDIASDLLLINGDIDKLVQVLTNLIENATKFTHNGGKIIVKAYDEDENVHITVSDNGIGIPNELISNLFDKFYQVDASTTRRYGGTGIGLHISKLIIEVHNGEIWAESDEGVGTTFHVTLPK